MRIKSPLIALCLLAASGGAVFAADHLDAPGASADPAADINDAYAWTSEDGTKLNLVMTVFPVATAASQFSDAVQYVFHTTSAPGFGGAVESVDIICQFDDAQAISCWAGDADYATGDASGAAGLASTNGTFTVFAGARRDPFFFNLEGFQNVLSIVKGAAASLTFDAAGCPEVSADISAALVSALASDAQGGAATDFFAPLNVLAIVVQIDKAAVTAGGDAVSVWAATRVRP